jgi:hypothetical protein
MAHHCILISKIEDTPGRMLRSSGKGCRARHRRGYAVRAAVLATIILGSVERASGSAHDTDAAATLESDAVVPDDLHGDAHPAASMRFSSTPLVLSATPGKMMFTFHLLGAVSGFRYRAIVREIHPVSGQILQEEAAVFAADGASYTEEVGIQLALLDAERDLFRLITEVSDAHPGLTSYEAVVAKKDITVPLVRTSPATAHARAGEAAARTGGGVATEAGAERAGATQQEQTWVHKYRALHARFRASLAACTSDAAAASHEMPRAAESCVPSETKFLVWSCRPQVSCGGLGNRFVSIVAAFLLALLTERAFFIDYPGSSDASLHRLLASAFIDWTLPPGFHQWAHPPPPSPT